MGTLYVVGTPIGNLEDMTLRAQRVLCEAALVAAEDTRKAHILLETCERRVPVTSFFAGNEHQKLATVLESLREGDVALISEAGMPGISDPGYSLVQAAWEQDMPVVPVPGPSAHTAALVVSGLPTERFVFLGFLPRRLSERAKVLDKVAELPWTLVFYEAPHRLEVTLRALQKALGNRALALCRELTKMYEDVWRGDIAGALTHLAEQRPRGEYTLVVAGAAQHETRWALEQVEAAFQEHMESGLSRSQAAREVASCSGWPRREIYALKLETTEGE